MNITHALLTLCLVTLVTSTAVLESMQCLDGEVVVPGAVFRMGYQGKVTDDACLSYLTLQLRSPSCFGQTTCQVSNSEDSICNTDHTFLFSHQCTKVENIYDICNKNVNFTDMDLGSIFFLTSPGYPSSFAKRKYCKDFEIPALANGLIYNILLQDLQLDYNNGRCHDKLRYTYVSNKYIVSNELCGDIDTGMNHHLEGLTFNAHERLTLNFVSDDFENEKRGFLLQFQVIKDSEETTVSAISKHPRSTTVVTGETTSAQTDSAASPTTSTTTPTTSSTTTQISESPSTDKVTVATQRSSEQSTTPDVSSARTLAATLTIIFACLVTLCL